MQSFIPYLRYKGYSFPAPNIHKGDELLQSDSEKFLVKVRALLRDKRIYYKANKPALKMIKN